ncbi:hypothetical protein [Streptomyces sp. NPDC005322]|uniref:hypothetical protein n=1 Tax=Streptomyces sp. NPDC005322 TaxID=3157032 RepID=UPI0033B43623
MQNPSPTPPAPGARREGHAPAAPAPAHPLLHHIPADQLTGLQHITPVGPGLVIVRATPDSERGAYEVTSWRPRQEWETGQDRAEWPGWEPPVVEYVSSRTLQDAAGIEAAIQEATEHLTARLARDAEHAAPAPAVTA